MFEKEGNVYDEGENRNPGVDIKAGGRALYNLTWNSYPLWVLCLLFRDHLGSLWGFR